MEEKNTCEICGYVSRPDDLVIHRIVPKEVATQAGMLDTGTAVLCINCSNEIQAWYDRKVYSVNYDDRAKRFVPKSPAEMVKEYEAEYKAFTGYKKRR